MRSKVILDVDPGIDDAMALLFAAASPELELVAITTVFGNASVEVTTANAVWLRDRFDLGAPVFAGADAPLVRSRGTAPDFIHGSDGLGDVGLPGRDATGAEPGPAFQRIAELVRANPHEITLIAVAPLTNLALALRHDPGIASLVKQVVVMGGAFGTGGRNGNVTPHAEANVHNDPDAAAIVLDAAWPVTMVGLDVTSRCVMTTAFAEDLAARAGEAGRFLLRIARPYIAAYAKYDGLDGCCLHDVAAVAYVLRPELFGTSSGPIDVDTGGDKIGRTAQQPAAQSGRPAQTACIDVDAGGVLRLYASTLVRANG